MLKERLRERQGGRGERVVGREGKREEDERGGRIPKPVCRILVSVPACFRLTSFFRHFVRGRVGPRLAVLHIILLALCMHGLRVRDLQRTARHWHMEATACLHAVYMHKCMSICIIIRAVNLLPRTTPVYGPRVRDLQRAARHSHEDMLGSTSRRLTSRRGRGGRGRGLFSPRL